MYACLSVFVSACACIEFQKASDISRIDSFQNGVQRALLQPQTLHDPYDDPCDDPCDDP